MIVGSFPFKMRQLESSPSLSSPYPQRLEKPSSPKERRKRKGSKKALKLSLEKERLTTSGWLELSCELRRPGHRRSRWSDFLLSPVPSESMWYPRLLVERSWEEPSVIKRRDWENWLRPKGLDWRRRKEIASCSEGDLWEGDCESSIISRSLNLMEALLASSRCNVVTSTWARELVLWHHDLSSSLSMKRDVQFETDEKNSDLFRLGFVFQTRMLEWIIIHSRTFVSQVLCALFFVFT